MFSKRRRGDQPDDRRRAAAAASAHEAGAAPGVRHVDESTMPRWRRPSLQQVRHTDPLRAMAEAAPSLSFESAGVRPLENFERRYIGYRLVRLLDTPDELRAREIGIVDQGDEVQLLQRHGAYWLVLCPDGRQGWIHRMTLAEQSSASILDEPEPMPQFEGEYEMPGLAEYPVENVADPSPDGLLESYMSARRDALAAMADESAAGDPSVPVLEFQGAVFAAPNQFAAAAQPAATQEPAHATEVAGAPEVGTAPSPEPAAEPTRPARARGKSSAQKTAPSP
jgi:hypothetical protein